MQQVINYLSLGKQDFHKRKMIRILEYEMRVQEELRLRLKEALALLDATTYTEALCNLERLKQHEQPNRADPSPGQR